MTRSQVLELRMLIERGIQSLPDEAAAKGVRLHPGWQVGQAYAVDFRVRYAGRLFKVVQSHTAQVGWEPDKAAALWTEICESHSGTLDDAIPYNGNMALEKGKYYTQYGVFYQCFRDTGNPVYQPLKELVGLYVEEV